MERSVATVTLRGSSPYSQSRRHDEPFLEGESHDAYDLRTWRSKMNVSDDGQCVVIPAFAIHQGLANAAKYSKIKIVGQGRATWTAKFNSGILIDRDPMLRVPDDPKKFIDPATVKSQSFWVDANGRRGSGSRVLRRFPMIYAWQSTFDIWILDPIITEPIFTEMMDLAGLFIGIGRYRPECQGTNGRFDVETIDWRDNRRLAA